MRLQRGPDHLGTLTIGDLPLELHSKEPFIAKTVAERYGTFLTDDIGDVRLELTLLAGGPRHVAADEASARSNDPTRVEPYDPVCSLDDHVLTMRSSVLDASVDFETGRGTIAVLACDRAAQYYLENALRQVVQVLALERDAILLHSAAVAPPSHDRVQLFAGRSGAGKSTISEILRDEGGHVLSDDLILLETRADRPRVGSTPFYGTLAPVNARREALPLTDVFLLEQAPMAEVSEPLARPAAVAALLANVPFTEPLDAAAHRRAMDILDRALSVVPVRRLRFRKDASMLPILGWTGAREEVLG